MAEQMTEAAKLFWKNLDVLAEAHRELTSYLDAVYEQSKEILESHWSANPQTKELPSLSYWTERENPGRWYISLPKSLVEINLVISDPRRSGDPRYYSVKLSTSDYLRRKMKKITSDAEENLVEIASDHGIQLSWDDNHKLNEENVEVAPDSASDTAAALTEVVHDRLVMFVAMDQWLKSRRDAATQNGDG